MSYGVGEDRLAQITCYRTDAPIVMDGDLTKAAWAKGPRSRRFVDMVTGDPALYETRVACRWDPTHFYVAYWIEEPQVRATLTERDSFIWNDNDVELFVAGDDCYYELEINAFGTVYEAFFVWQDALKRGSRVWIISFAVATARSAGSGCSIGAPNTALIPSPE